MPMPLPPRLPIPIVLLLSLMVMMILVLVQALAVLAQLFDGEGLPDVLLAAGVLDQRGRVAEGGEGEGDVLAGVLVGVVAAHPSFFLFCFVCVRFGLVFCCFGRGWGGFSRG